MVQEALEDYVDEYDFFAKIEKWSSLSFNSSLLYCDKSFEVILSNFIMVISVINFLDPIEILNLPE